MKQQDRGSARSSQSSAAHLFPYILVPGVAEILLALGLLVMGVSVQRWMEQAGAASQLTT